MNKLAPSHHRSRIEPLEARIAPAVIFTVEPSTNKLVSFDSATPGTLTGDVTITGLQANELIAAIDFRPETGELYGLGLVDDGATRTGRLYEIDPTTAAATLVGAGPFSATLADTDRYGFDFDPTTDTIRVTNLLDANFRLDPNDGTFAGIDVNISNGVAGEEIVVAVAYDRNFGSTKTTLFGYDFQTDNLVTIGGLDSSPSPDGGLTVLVADSTLGGVPFSTNATFTGFDIGGPFGGADVGWLSTSTSTSGGAHLYTIDLATAVMTDLGLIGAGGRGFGGLSVQLDAADPAISTDGKTAKWTDLDGDEVTLKINKGALTGANFRMLAGTGSTTGLAKLTLTDTAFTGTNVTLTAKPGANGGDGRVNVGEINATGVDLGAVTIPGDLIAIDAGTDAAPAQSLKSLTVASMGAFGLGLLSGTGNTVSLLADGAGKISIAGDLRGFFELGKNKTGSITIGGDVIGGTDAGRGGMANLTGTSTLGKLTIKGSIRAEKGENASQVNLEGVGAATIGGDIVGALSGNGGDVQIGGTGKTSITIGGSIIGGIGGGSGHLTVKNAASLKIGGSVLGGGSFKDGALTLDQCASLKIGGSVVGGAGIASALIEIAGTTAITIKGSILGGDGGRSACLEAFGPGTFVKSLAIGGSVVAKGQAVKLEVERFGKITIGGSVTGIDGGSVSIVGFGIDAPANAAESIAIGSLTIGGDVKNAIIAAGVNSFLNGNTADAAIGAVKIGGNFVASSISAGILPTNGKFGDADDAFVGGNTGNAAIIAKIASITIGGQLLGTNGGAPDSFGILAEQIGALTVNKIKVPLTIAKDDLTLGFTADVRVREL